MGANQSHIQSRHSTPSSLSPTLSSPALKFWDGSPIETELQPFTKDQILTAVTPFTPVSRAQRRSRCSVLQVISQQSQAVQNEIRATIHLTERNKNKRPLPEDTSTTFPSAKKTRGRGQSVASSVGTLPPDTLPSLPRSDVLPPTPPPTPVQTTAELLTGPFLRAPTNDTVEACIARFIERTNNTSLAMSVCMVCAREMPAVDVQTIAVADIPNKTRLEPGKPHEGHTLTGTLLLHAPAVRNQTHGELCCDCKRSLVQNKTPALSLANNMWIGQVPHELAVLTLPERILVARYFPAAYVVKLYPKKKGAQYWDKAAMNSGMKGNVSTYYLNTSDISSMIDGNKMPPPAKILAATIGISFVGPANIPERTLPDVLRVRRGRVRKALVWLKAHNPAYANIEISSEALEQLPLDGIPEELLAIVKLCPGNVELMQEMAGYVPQDDDEPDSTELHPPYIPGVSAAGLRDLDFYNEDVIMSEPSEPGVFPLQALGVVDAGGSAVPDSDLLAHALSNTMSDDHRGYNIRRGSAFVNEYPRTDEATQCRTDGGPDNPNHLLGAFPVLFPYGAGGLETSRVVDVPYETHVKWALQYADRRFRKDLHFAFQVFGVIQKRQICRSACLQITRSVFVNNETAIQRLKPKDFLQASSEETRRVPFSNPAIQSLRTNLSALRSKVSGTDESRKIVRNKIWSMIVMKAPPSIWMTLNPSDTNSPIAQIMAGAEIDMDKWIATAGPDSNTRSITIAGDPYAAARFFHFVIQVILEELFGIHGSKNGSAIRRREGVLGTVESYIGTVEAQGRGTLHVHLLLWLSGALSASKMKEALTSDEFREKVSAYIKTVIRADLDGADSSEVGRIPKERCVAYARPVDPREPGYTRKAKNAERTLAKAVQLHTCSKGNCLIVVKNKTVCKRRAPFELATREWVNEAGQWGPKRTCAFLNNWCPAVLQVLQSNHDIKLITNGVETKDITWYITVYTTKKQHNSGNTSALLAQKLAYHQVQEKRNSNLGDLNRKLIQRCANTLSREQEFSAPEVISYLMGWGDRFISHNFVSIYLDSVLGALKGTFPALRANWSISTENTEFRRDHSSTEQSGDSDELASVEVVNGKLVLRDQLKEYSDRGIALESSNFLDFFINTYNGVETSSKAKGKGRPTNTRVPYLESAERGHACRVVRSHGHEMMPLFVGTWFPRNDRPHLKERYSAMMLAFFTPWRTLADLKAPGTTFSETFERIQESASPRLRFLLENIQYFHECSDGKRDQPEGGTYRGGGVVELGDVPLYEAEPSEDSDGMEHLTEEECLQQARDKRYPARERLYAEVAMGLAADAGVFEEAVEAGGDVESPVNARRASQEDHTHYQSWASTIENMTNIQTNPSTDTAVENLGSVQAAKDHVEPGVEPDFTRLPESTKSVEPQQHETHLNTEQMLAYNIIENHLNAHLARRKPKQLLMFVRGQGGTGKSTVIAAITRMFARHGAANLLAKTATTGVAATIIGGRTLHSFAGIGIRVSAKEDWVNTGSAEVRNRRKDNFWEKEYLLIDESSMVTKDLEACTSEVAGRVRSENGNSDATLPFGGLNVIMFGDFHQFPPVSNPSGALYCPESRTERGNLGRAIYTQFETVVTLKQQMRIVDEEWSEILGRSRDGECTESDLKEIRRLVLGSPDCEVPNFSESPWRDAILVTPRHGVRVQWNHAKLVQHCEQTGNALYVCRAEDTSAGGHNLTRHEKVIVAEMKEQSTGKLPEMLELSIGMKVMVTTNIATEADLANGTRGEVTDIVLDPREGHVAEDESGLTYLQYPPAMILFKPLNPTSIRFEGLEAGIIPIFPAQAKFSITNPDKSTRTITRNQFALTGGYAFTDYKSQGQTIEYVIVDLGKPPVGRLTPFNAYVALSRSRGRGTIRLLRDFEDDLFTKHPSEDLRDEDLRLERLTSRTEKDYSKGLYNY